MRASSTLDYWVDYNSMLSSTAWIVSCGYVYFTCLISQAKAASLRQPTAGTSRQHALSGCDSEWSRNHWCASLSPDTYLCCLGGELTLEQGHVPIITAFKDLGSYLLPLQLCLAGLPADSHSLPLWSIHLTSKHPSSLLPITTSLSDAYSMLQRLLALLSLGPCDVF